MNRRAFFRAVGKALLAVPAVGVTAKLLPESEFATHRALVDNIEVYESDFGKYKYSEYKSLGSREDLSDLIYDIEPTEMPFLNMGKP